MYKELYFYSEKSFSISDSSGFVVQRYYNEVEFWDGVNNVWHAVPLFCEDN